MKLVWGHGHAGKATKPEAGVRAMRGIEQEGSVVQDAGAGHSGDGGPGRQNSACKGPGVECAPCF